MVAGQGAGGKLASWTGSKLLRPLVDEFGPEAVQVYAMEALGFPACLVHTMKECVQIEKLILEKRRYDSVRHD